MVKVPQPNNFAVGRFFGGDDEEPQDMMARGDSLVEGAAAAVVENEQDQHTQGQQED